MYLPPFQGTISNWTICSKAFSWTGVGYYFVISTSIKQVKSLELILSVSFAFGSCCCEPTSCGQRISPYRWNRQLLGFKNKTNPSESRNIRSGQINSLVHSKKKKKKRMHWWAQQHKKAWTSTEDNSCGWSENHLRAKEKPFHNIQPRE